MPARPMSNNGGISSATNGRSGSTSSSSGGGGGLGGGSVSINIKPAKLTTVGTTSISQKNDGGGGGGVVAKKLTNTNINSTISNSKTLPDKVSKQNNDNNKLNATHRRDNSTIGGCSALGQKDAHKFQYGKPQTNQIINPGLETAASTAATDKEAQLVYYDGKLVSATLETLIKHTVPTHEYYPERHYLFAFLLSVRLFIRPHEVLAQISQTWERQQQQQSQDVVDEAVHFGGNIGGGSAAHINAAALSANSASPLTQRKSSTTSTAAANVVVELEPKQQQRTATQKSAQNCIRLLSEWIETFPYDFRDERLMQQVRILARKCVYIDNSLGKQVSRILQTLVARLTALEQYEEFLQTLHVTTQTDLNPNDKNSTLGGGGYHNHGFQPLFGTSAAAAYNSSGHNSNNHHTILDAGKHIGSNLSNSNSSGSNSASTTPQPDDVYGIMDICPSCAHLAHQLTAIELERLSHIGPEEFVQAFAKDYQQTAVTTSVGAAGNAANVMCSSLNDMKKTRNLESYVEWFNRLSYLTASEIVKYPKKKQRVRVIEYWIETARECFNIGNFNSLVAIIAGLNLAPISRLKKTWSKVQSAKFSVLEHQMDPTSNFNSYRSTLKAAMWRSEGATDERERIIIPFFSLFVKDLYFVNEGCSNRLPNNHINFEKCSQLAKQIMEFDEWKKVNCPYEKLPHVIAYLQHNSVLNETTLAMASFECEPPENTEEKDRYKTVKAETKQQLLQQLQEQQNQQQ